MRNVFALALAALAFFVEVWTIVPAPSRTLLFFGLVVPEVAPWGIAGCAIALGIAYVWSSGWARAASLTLAGAALIFAVVPLAQIPATLAAADAQMRAAGDAAPAAGPRFDAVRLFGGPRRDDPPPHVDRALPFATRDGATSALDLYRPAGTGAHPTVVVIHGGGWRSGSRESNADDDAELAARGFTVVAIDYRLAPARRFPTQLDDVRDALGAIARNAAAWGVDTRRVALLGRSAGGELALLAGFQSEALPVRAIAVYYAPTDLDAGYREPPVPDPWNVRALVRDYMGGTPDELPGAYRAASPLNLVRAGLPPTLLIGGIRDELVSIRFQRQLRDTLAAHGDRVVAIELPWSNHAFDEVPDGLGTQVARSYVAEFLTATL